MTSQMADRAEKGQRQVGQEAPQEEVAEDSVPRLPNQRWLEQGQRYRPWFDDARDVERGNQCLRRKLEEEGKSREGGRKPIR